MALWHRYGWVAYLAVFIGVLGHASAEFFAVLSEIGGPELSVWRFILGGGGLIALALAFPDSRDLITPLRTHSKQIVMLSLFGISGGYLAFHWSLDFASVPQVATIVTAAPLFVGITNFLVNQQPFGVAKIVSGICALSGIVLLVTDGYLATLAGSFDSLIGVLMALASSIFLSIYMVLIRPVIAIYGALRITAISLFIGAVGLWFVVGLVFDIWVQPESIGSMPPIAIISLLTLAIWNTTITQFLWLGGLAAVPDITRGSYLFFLKPVIAALLAVMILGQDLTIVQSIAILFVTASVAAEFLVDRFKSKIRN
ncbi:MAG: EamA family transporter [Magnetovibrio sp.]|nr:EamA family transporter [Magnetovibrio sp.]